jgi:hypothetical protein
MRRHNRKDGGHRKYAKGNISPVTEPTPHAPSLPWAGGIGVSEEVQEINPLWVSNTVSSYYEEVFLCKM